MKAYILTTDRYWPWNGENTHRTDRIWNNLDELLDVQYLVYCAKNPVLQAGIHKRVKYIKNTFNIKSFIYFLTIFFKSHILALIKCNRKLLLGDGLPYLKGAIKWYWAYARLRNYLESQQVDVIIYHGEFNSWGLSVARACKDSGVAAIAWQHGIMPVSYEQYKLTDSDKRHLPLPSYLFLWSMFSKHMADDLIGDKIPNAVVGQARITVDYDHFSRRDEFIYLVCPSVFDYNNYVNYLEKNQDLFAFDKRLLFKMHPLRIIESRFKRTYNCVAYDINMVLKDVSVVLVSCGTVAIEALRMQIPVIVVEEFCEERYRSYRSEMPGLFIRRTFSEALELVGEIEKYGDSLDRSQFHQTARYYADDINVSAVKDIIGRLCERKQT